MITQKYLWQGQTRLLAVYDGSDRLLMRFEYADARMPVAMTKDGIRYYLTYDQVGSLRAIADAGGNMIKRIHYDSFGNILTDTDSLSDIPFGFAGGLHDRDTGLVRFGARDYDPDTGRWTAKDPIGFAGGDTSLYGYCLGDPVNRVDQLGLVAAIDDATIGAIGALIALAYYSTLPPEQKAAMAQDLERLWEWLWSLNENTSDDEEQEQCPPDEKLGKKDLEELKKVIKEDGIPSIEHLKVPGGKGAGKYDLFVKPNGDIVVKPKSGLEPGDPTGYNVNNL